MSEDELNNPFLENLGARLVAWRDGYAEMSLPLSPTLQNRSGAVQGGAICTLLDAVGGYAGLFMPPGAPWVHSLTVSLTTNFLDNREGALLTGKGYVERRGGAIYFSRAEVWLDDALLLATAMGTYRYLRAGERCEAQGGYGRAHAHA
jgi:acyl-coenzyme A thioesterase PaaI-like protein